jgi:hypothetical protein
MASLQAGGSADWKRLLLELLDETDKARLKQKANDLEAAIFYRSQELEHSADGACRKGSHQGSYYLTPSNQGRDARFSPRPNPSQKHSSQRLVSRSAACIGQT